ncbi:MAG: hypothetical protein DID92_2727744273 [Candidatus Nitrotoga sp. SPKER]|nr:MAG: hypothetical protein DID92_2727744273 [Candidatus Nitrotoga sp. SPKER]
MLCVAGIEWLNRPCCRSGLGFQKMEPVASLGSIAHLSGRAKIAAEYIFSNFRVKSFTWAKLWMLSVDSLSTERTTTRSLGSHLFPRQVNFLMKLKEI